MFKVSYPWYKVIARQITQCSNYFAITVSICNMLIDFQNGVILQNPVKQIQSFSWIAVRYY